MRQYFVALVFVIAAHGLLSITAASELTDDRVEIGAWKKMAESLGYPEAFPSIVLFAPDGSCVLRAELDLDWSAAQIEQPEDLVSDSDCEIFTDDRSALDPPVWTLVFNTLDAPFCSACGHVESELMALRGAAPERWRLSISRVYFSD